MDLRSHHFGSFFEAIHGHRPFPWQQQLLVHLAETDEWPDVLDLPTGSGKTAALDIAVFHLALRADDPARAAVRVALVVDRRLVVDSAHERARKIAEALQPAGRQGHSVLETVGSRLQNLAGDGEPPLVAARLRGGAPLEPVWARSPSQPTVLCSTVDQVGSRLLFRGYGVSDRMKPIHAGLLGEGTLILLDEAHLSEPFRQTLGAVQKLGRARLRTVLLTATPGAKAEQPFRLSAADRSHPELKRRVSATKPTRLVLVKRAVPEQEFANEALAMMDRLAKGCPHPPAVGVVVNRVALARNVFAALRAATDCETALMIGRARGVDRDRVAEQLQPFFTGVEDRAAAKPIFIVATQCLEVGVDLDLDGLVTQAASLDALRQRFGRLNRAGRPVEAEGSILALSVDIAKRSDDPVYGDRIRRTWEALTNAATASALDFGSEAMDARGDLNSEQLSAPRPDAPVVMPAYLDLWAQTAPVPACDPEVGLFLHGAERAEADLSVVWRDDVLDAEMRPAAHEQEAAVERLGERLALLPPRSAEMVQVPIAAARRWLQDDRVRSESVEIADVPQASTPEEGRVGNSGRPGFRWAGPGDPRTGLVRPHQLCPGDLIVVPASYGGCDEFGWVPGGTEAPVVDVADEAARPYRANRCAVRLRASRFRERSVWSRVSAVLARREGMAPDDLLGQLLDALLSEPSGPAVSSDAADGVAPLDSTREVVEAMGDAVGPLEFLLYTEDDPGGGALLFAPRGLAAAQRPNAPEPTTEHGSFSQSFGRPVLLSDHGRHVADTATVFAGALHLDQKTVEDLRLAAWLHDAGKADPRFQTVLSGAGNPWNAPEDPEQVFAKSGRPPQRGAGKRAGLPDGWRHEALSVRLALVHPDFAHAHDPALVLWLIGTHHGLGRPFFGFTDAASPPPLAALGVNSWDLTDTQPGPDSPAFDFDGFDWPALAADLRDRYGAWRLAFYEALIRLADHRASEREREQAG
jgi:CRISPR-associated endonuclease/helicase Cas3